MTDRRPLRLLHTSDVHIGATFTTPKDGEHHEVCQCPVQAIAALAKAHDVDAVLVVGDLFDHGRVPEADVAASLDVLGSMGVPAVLIPGNHDLHHHEGLYRRYDAALGRSGLHFLGETDGSKIELFGGALHLWGKAMDDHYPGFRPLLHAPDRPVDDAWYVVLGHGHFVGDEDPETQMRSSPITSGHIGDTGADYVALGHWHVVTDVSHAGVPAWYCGSPVLTWGDGGAILLELDPVRGAVVSHVPAPQSNLGCAHTRV